MTNHSNDAMASIENNALAMAQQVRMKSSIESKVAHNEAKTLFVSCNDNSFSISELGNNRLTLQENDSWWCVIQGDPDAWAWFERLIKCEDGDDEQVLIPFANPESWRNDVAELHPSVDKSRTSLYKVFITKCYNMDGRVTYIPSFVFVETMEQDLSTPESNQLADVSDELPF